MLEILLPDGAAGVPVAESFKNDGFGTACLRLVIIVASTPTCQQEPIARASRQLTVRDPRKQRSIQSLSTLDVTWVRAAEKGRSCRLTRLKGS